MRFAIEDIRFVGAGLRRPECVLAHASGLLIASDWTDPGGVSLIAPNGQVSRLLATRPGPGVETPVRPNGILLEPGGSILLTHLGETRGGVYRLWPDGRCDLVTNRVGDAPMPPANFIARDCDGRLWITVSTRRVPRALDYRPDAATGFVAVHDDAGTRLVADGLGYTNECLFSPDGGRLRVVETFARRLSVFDVAGDRLGARRTLARFGPGDFPDGMAETADGALVVTSIVSNRLLRVDWDGAVETLLEDADPARLAEIEAAFQAAEMGRPHLDTPAGRGLGHLSSIAFAGPELRTACLGTLLGDAIGCLESPVAGRPPPHWDVDLGPLARALEDSR